MAVKSSPAARDRSGIVVGVLLLVVACVLWFDAVRLSGVVSYGVGPAAAPKIVAIGLVVLGLLSVVSGLRASAIELDSVDWKAVGLIVAGFLALTVIIGLRGGFIPAMVVLFVAASTAFGRRAFVQDAALGAILSVAIYLLFSKLLTLSLPQGPIERLFG